VTFNPLKAELNPICHLLALLGAHHIPQVSGIRVKGREPVKYKSVTDKKYIEQVNHFNYLENLIPHDKEVDVDNKFNNYFKITGIINNMFRP
jgi:hypothetical protein